VETDFRVRSAGRRTPAAGRRDNGRHPEIRRPLITRPGRPGIAAAVSSLPFGSVATITESRRYRADPFAGNFFIRIEFRRPEFATRIADLAGNSGELAGRFSPPGPNDNPHLILPARPEAGPAKGGRR